MDLEKMKARLAEIVAKLDDLGKVENFTSEQVTEVSDLNDEYETLKNNIEAREKIEMIRKNSQTSTRKVKPENTRVQVSSPSDKNFGFKNAKDFFGAVRNIANGKVDERLTNAQYEKYGEDGGFLIPPDFNTAIMEKIGGDESLLSRTTQYTTSSNNLYLIRDESQPFNNTGHVKAYWNPEGGEYTSSKQAIESENIRLHKLTALVRVTEEMSEDASAMESHIRAKAPEAINYKLNNAIISGDGVGKPLGYLNSGFKYQVAAEGGQSADTVIFENIVNMYSRQMRPDRAVWLINPAVMPQLRKMAFVDGAASPVPAYMPPSGLAGAPYGTLMGRPIFPMMSGVKALGDEGDISFIDFSYYTTAVKGAGVREDMSTHVFWLEDIKAFKFSFRVGGQCLFTKPATTENGDYKMSGIVTLADR